MTAEYRDKLARDLYLDLLKRVLTRSIVDDVYFPLFPIRAERLTPARRLRRAVVWLLAKRNLVLARHRFDPASRELGEVWPSTAETMIGLRRLGNIQQCVETILREGVPGDLIGTGVWRGGAVIFMRAVLKAYGCSDRIVRAADSFRGLPKPDATKYPADADDTLWTSAYLAVPLDEVRANFERYGLLDEQVRFLPGWFEDTLPAAPIGRLALLRLDGDMYGSTMVALEALYDRLAPGGFLIVDAYSRSVARRAVDDFRERRGITEHIEPIDNMAVYWPRAGDPHETAAPRRRPAS